MKLKSISLVFVVLITTGAFALFSKNEKGAYEKEAATKAEKGIQFLEGDFSKAKEEATKQHKLIFLDAYASWCGPCKLLKRKTFPDKTAGEFFNEHFISVAVDMEEGQGPALASQYAVDAYPTLIVTDAKGNLVTYTKGYMDAGQLIKFGKYALEKAGVNK